MALTPTPSSSSYPNTLQFSVKSPSPFVHYLLFRSRWGNASPISLQKSGVPPLRPLLRPSFKEFKCFTRSSSTEEDRLRESETLAGDDDDGGREDPKVQQRQSDSFLLGIREPVYEVFIIPCFLEVK